MIRKVLHIIVIAVLALNLMGIWAFASAFDCGMECCKPDDWTGTVSYEAPSCCQMDDITCDFETGQYEELFDTAICCFNTSDGQQLTADSLSYSGIKDTFTHSPKYPFTELSPVPHQEQPLYLSNASFLC